jgi:TolB protein
MSSLNENEEIYSNDTKGTNPVNLTKHPASDYSPEWSPDGKQIAFVSERNGNPEIYLMNRDGSGVTRLTDRPGGDLAPAWSPDGKKIVFSSNRNTRYNLYILDIKTGSIERLTNGEHDIFPDWSPDGRLIIFQSTRKSGQAIYTIDVNTREEVRISENSVTSVARPVWSPNGQSYLHESKVATNKIGIVISEYLGGLFETVVGPGYSNLWPAWSPNGGQIVFVSYRNGDSDIYIVSRDGKLLYRVTNDDRVEGMVDWTPK